jgi:hypothetical protein
MTAQFSVRAILTRRNIHLLKLSVTSGSLPYDEHGCGNRLLHDTPNLLQLTQSVAIKPFSFSNAQPLVVKLVKNPATVLFFKAFVSDIFTSFSLPSINLAHHIGF